MEKMMREMEIFQEGERENLRRIRSHRARKNTWRHFLRVKRIKGILGGLTMIAGSFGILLVEHGGDATYMLLTLPLAVCLILNGAD